MVCTPGRAVERRARGPQPRPTPAPHQTPPAWQCAGSCLTRTMKQSRRAASTSTPVRISRRWTRRSMSASRFLSTVLAYRVPVSAACRQQSGRTETGASQQPHQQQLRQACRGALGGATPRLGAQPATAAAPTLSRACLASIVSCSRVRALPSTAKHESRATCSRRRRYTMRCSSCTLSGRCRAFSSCGHPGTGRCLREAAHKAARAGACCVQALCTGGRGQELTAGADCHTAPAGSRPAGSAPGRRPPPPAGRAPPLPSAAPRSSGPPRPPDAAGPRAGRPGQLPPA